MKRFSFIFCAAGFCVFFLSCKINTSGIALITGDFTPPKLISVEVRGETELALSFTKGVRPVRMRVEEGPSAACGLTETGREAGAQNPSLVETSFSGEETENLTVTLGKAGEIGKTYTLQGSVIDKNGNTLTFLTEFRAYNPRVPKLVLSEVRTVYTKPKVEFIELYTQTAGNLAGVCVFNSYNGETCRYEFPPVEVAADEYIVLHLRNIEADTIDETETTDVSAGTEAFPSSRDFWEDNTASRLSKTCVVLLEARKGGKLLDALLLAESKYAEWPKAEHAAAAKRAFESGVWGGGYTPADAVTGDATTTTRTFSRQGNLQTAGTASKADWIIVASGNATPGKENSTKAYVALGGGIH